MARPKANTKEGQIANEKWRKTMTEKYGSITEKMRETGRIGGQNGKGPDYKGGFAGNRLLAITAGAKGGSISKRKSPHAGKIEENRNKIVEILKARAEKQKENGTLKDLSKEIDVPYSALIHYIKKNIDKE